MKRLLQILNSTIVASLLVLATSQGYAKAAATVAFTCSGTLLYENTPDLAQPSLLSKLTLSSSSGVTKDIYGTASGAVNAMGYRTQDNFLYAVGVGEGNHNHLFKFDAAGGESDLGEVLALDDNTNVTAGAFAADGFLYVTSIEDDTTMYKIDVSDHTATTITLSGETLQRLTDFAYNINDGKFYGYDNGATGDTADGQIKSITTAGVVSNVGPAAQPYYGMGAIWVFGDTMYGLENRTGLLREFSISGANAGTVIGSIFQLSPPDGEPNTSAQHDGASCATASFAPPVVASTTPALPDTATNPKPYQDKPWAAVLLSAAIVGFISTGSYLAYRKIKTKN